MPSPPSIIPIILITRITVQTVSHSCHTRSHSSHSFQHQATPCHPVSPGPKAESDTMLPSVTDIEDPRPVDDPSDDRTSQPRPPIPDLRHSCAGGNPSPPGCVSITPEAVRYTPPPNQPVDLGSGSGSGDSEGRLTSQVRLREAPWSGRRMAPAPPRHPQCRPLAAGLSRESPASSEIEA